MSAEVRETMRTIRRRVHREMVAALDFDRVYEIAREDIAEHLRREARRRVEALAPPLNGGERDEVVEQILDEILGLGPLEPLLRDPEVTQILVTAPETIGVVRRGAHQQTTSSFDDRAHLAQIVELIIDGSRRAGNLVSIPPHGFRGRMVDDSPFEATLPPTALGSATLLITRG